MIKVPGFKVNKIIKWPIGGLKKGMQKVQKWLRNYENGMDTVKKAQRSSLGAIDQEIKHIQKLLGNGKVETARELLEKKVLPELTKVDVSLLPMLHIPGRYYNIMKNEVAVGQFKQFVESSGYKIEGHNAQRLLQNLADPSQFHKAVSCVNYFDEEAYAKWLSAQTGREFRIPTEDEWKYAMFYAMTYCRKDMKDEGFEWTLTKWGKRYILHSLFVEKKLEKLRQEAPSLMPVETIFLPHERYINTCMRLIDVIKVTK